MGEIKLNKVSYDACVSELDAARKEIEVNGINSVDSGENNTIAIDTFITIFRKHKKMHKAVYMDVGQFSGFFK